MKVVGARFGRLTLIEESAKRDSTRCRFWVARCDCGSRVLIRSTSLGRSLSCGCLQREAAARENADRALHGHARRGAHTPTWNTWISMIQRCTYPSEKAYRYYGARGISVCERWRNDFATFLADMGERPAGKTIDRIDNNKGYEPDNCRWATRHEQSRNRRSNVLIEINGIRKCLSDWCQETGVKQTAAISRIRRGWLHERAVTEQTRSQA